MKKSHHPSEGTQDRCDGLPPIVVAVERFRSDRTGLAEVSVEER